MLFLHGLWSFGNALRLALAMGIGGVGFRPFVNRDGRSLLRCKYRIDVAKCQPSVDPNIHKIRMARYQPHTEPTARRVHNHAFHKGDGAA